MCVNCEGNLTDCQVTKVTPSYIRLGVSLDSCKQTFDGTIRCTQWVLSPLPFKRLLPQGVDASSQVKAES